MCDASNYAVGAVVGQTKDKKHYAHWPQLNYATTGNELLAVVFVIDKFRSYLVGAKVIVYSDHAALKYLLTNKDAKPRHTLLEITTLEPWYATIVDSWCKGTSHQVKIGKDWFMRAD